MLSNRGYILKWRQSNFFRGVVVCLLLNLLAEIIQPTVAMALTEGPSQPEVQSFEPIGTTQMVDMFSGDFNYNIPLFNLPGPNGGYPVNLAYHAGVSMDDEASWVGLGWNINVGSLVRNVRGIPDEFKSTLVSGSDDEANENSDYFLVKSDIKQNWTLGLSAGAAFEVVGADINALGLNASIYYNNYTGIGFSTGANVGLTDSPFSLGLSLDSENGVGVSATASLDKNVNNVTRSHEFTVSFDGALSLDYSISYKAKDFVSARKNPISGMATFSYGSQISLARNNFIPAQANRYNVYSLNLKVKGGIQAILADAGFSAGIFFNTQDMDDKDKEGRRLPVIGYTEVGYTGINAESLKKYTLDYTRVNDGQITKASMFLPYPVYNYDVYNSTGQGLSGYFRPRRSDIGRVYDPENTNETFGVNVTLDFGAGSNAKFGLGAGANYGHSQQGPWNNNNAFQLEFTSPEYTGSTKENVYYQAHGEQTVLHDHEMDHIRGFSLPFVRLAPNEPGDGVAAQRKINQSSVNSAPNDDYSLERVTNERVVRNTLIHKLTNAEASKLGEFKVPYFNSYAHATQSLSADQYLNRSTRSGVNISGHPAGYKVLNEDGTYYVYGLPAYNNKEIENVFSVLQPSNAEALDKVPVPTNGLEVDYEVNGTDKYIRKTTKSPYAHSYLLTSVQGADYVDLKNDGPTDDDLGYWVKFSYVKYDDNYKWRTPYTQAMYNRGSLYTPEDDKGSYQYGEKEVWYVGQIETKSHVAVFDMSPRQDMEETLNEFGQVPTNPGATGLKVDRIKIYTKEEFKKIQNGQEAVALQIVHFDYSYDLCPGIPNSTASGTTGKLTLTKLWFTSNGSTRGEDSHYSFSYNESPNDPLGNPQYSANAYDSWGTYKPKGISYEAHSNFPYTNQFNQDWGILTWEPDYGTFDINDATKALTKSTQDKLSSAWCLKRIDLPSGGSINIEYESDDYGYVQHKTANQMFKIARLNDFSAPDEIYNVDGNTVSPFYNTFSEDDERRRRIYFKLEEPIPVGTANVHDIVYRDYVEPLIRDENKERNLYFKAKIELVDGHYEFVNGYLPLEDKSSLTYGVGSELSSDQQFYTTGFVTVKAGKKRKKINGEPAYFKDYHPMALAAWTYLQTNAQKLLNNPNSFENSSSFSNADALIGKMVDLMNIIPATASNFGAIRAYCESQGMAHRISLDLSVIRLASPDKIKYGGGHRVKKISITDNWSAHSGENGSDRTYGQEYEYTLYEGSRKISSGVALYEPQAGGDENALKYPIYFAEKASVFTKNNLFAEAPMNEQLFPGASVGYRQVTVKSLNTGKQQRNAQQGSGTTPTGRTGGVTVYEFYTAREFPTMVEYSTLKEENNSKDVKNINIPIPLIGSITRNLYHGTQAYMIELNDMHGKPKSVKTFEVNNYLTNTSPVTEVSYEYLSFPLIYQDEQVYKLDNNVSVIPDNDAASVTIGNRKKLMGIEYDMFTDQRQNTTYNFSAHVDVNLDVPTYPIPIPTVWPSSSESESTFRTYVTNKVIHRSGILKRTYSRDIQTVNETEIIAYDEKSGQALLTKVKNEFGDDFYNYNIPAHYVYERMGHAYQNINFAFRTNLVKSSHSHDADYVSFTPTANELNALVRGDELLVTGAPNSNSLYQKGYFLGWRYNCVETNSNVVEGMIHFPNVANGILNGGSSMSNVTLKVIRSGRRNHYASVAANYLTKGLIDPTQLTDLTLASSNVVGDNTTIKTKSIAENVLAASATVYREDWPLSNHITEGRKGSSGPRSTGSGSSLFAQGLTAVENPYTAGVSGIWRPLKTYSYVGKRKSSASMTDNVSSDPALYDDGVFNNSVPLFTWELGDMEDYVPEWEWVNEITRYSQDSYEIENRNRLDIKSSALYGYDNSLSIGVSGNAGYYEVGVEDFETAPFTDWRNSDRITQTHLNFHNLPDYDGVVISERTAIKDAVYDCEGQLSFYIKNPTEYLKYFFSNAVYGQSNSTSTTFGLSLISRKNAAMEGNKNYFLNGSLVSSALTTVGGVESLYVKIKPYYYCADEDLLALKARTEFTGNLVIYEHRDFIPRTYVNDVSVTTEKAHTGKRSMKLKSTGWDMFFDQPMLKTLKNKKYIASCWISRDNTDVTTFRFQPDAHPVTPGYISAGNFVTLPNGSYKITYGKVVEGWQKVDIEYSVDNFLTVIAFKIMPGFEDLYVDDFRVSPKTGGLTTYVYDSEKFWLKASLNVDNYATLFFYDEEGNLTLKKQETEEGIMTVTESRGHISEQQ